MMTWTVPNRVLAAYADNLPPVKVRCVMGKTSPVWSANALAVSGNGAPQHQVLATFTGPKAMREAHAYAQGGFAARVAKAKAAAK